MSGAEAGLHPDAGGDQRAVLDAYGLHEAAPEAAFDGVVLLARGLCAASAALVSVVGEERQWLLARSGFSPTWVPLEQSVCVHALRDVGVLVIPDLVADARTRDNPLVSGASGFRFYAGAPLRTPIGHALGTLCVLDTLVRPGGLSEEQAEGLQALAALIMGHLELRRLLRAREAEVVQLRAQLASA